MLFVSQVRIKSLSTTNKDEVTLGKVNILIGPNNVGKSRLLRDIYDKMRDRYQRTMIINSIQYEFANDYENFMSDIKIEDSNNTNNYKVLFLNPNLRDYIDFEIVLDILHSFESNYMRDKNQMFEEYFSKTKVVYLDASSRLDIAKSVEPVHLYNSSQIKLLQVIAENPDNIEEDLQKIFKRAFEMDIKLDYYRPGIISFKIGKNNDFKVIPDQFRKLKNFMKSFPNLDDQGDGFKSFVGIILGILLCKDKIILIDEPEAFLHPTQIRALGNWIGEHSLNNNNQVIIATHNSNFLNSILNNKDLNILRLERHNNFTQSNHLSSDSLSTLSKDLLLSSLSILDSLFHMGVILCEGDSDRVFYKATMNKLTDYNEDILFINTRGKHTMKRIIPFIKELNVPFKLIVDFDILLSADEFDKIVKLLAATDNHNNLISLRKNFSEVITGMSEEDMKTQISNGLTSILKNTSSISLSQLKKGIENITEISRTDMIKRNGINSIEAKNKPLVQQIIQEAKNIGLFIIPYGDLESWYAKSIQKKDWIENALIEVNHNNIPPNLKQFLNDIYGDIKKK